MRRVQVQDPVRLAVANRAQDHRLGLQGPGHEGTILCEAMAKKITVYTTDPCSCCVRVKDLLNKRGL